MAISVAHGQSHAVTRFMGSQSVCLDGVSRPSRGPILALCSIARQSSLSITPCAHRFVRGIAGKPGTHNTASAHQARENTAKRQSKPMVSAVLNQGLGNTSYQAEREKSG